MEKIVKPKNESDKIFESIQNEIKLRGITRKIVDAEITKHRKNKKIKK